MSTTMSLLSMRQLCFFTHYPPFVKAAELVRLALVVRQQSEEAVDADDIELVRELLLVGTHGSPDAEQLDELLFMLEDERESVRDAFRHCAVGVGRALVLGNERLLGIYALMTYLVDGGALYCDGKCEWPNDEWAVEDNDDGCKWSIGALICALRGGRLARWSVRRATALCHSRWRRQRRR